MLSPNYQFTRVKSILVFLLLFSLSASAQKTRYLNKFHVLVEDSASAVFFSKIFRNPNTLEAVVRTYYLDGVKVSEEQFSNYEKWVRDGVTKAWYPNGQLKHEINYRNNTFNGDLKSYYANGQIRRHDQYAQGNLIEGHCFAKTGADTTYHPFQILPSFPGKNAALTNFIKANIRSPHGMHPDSQKHGMVIARFSVNPDGSISDIKIMKGLSPYHDEQVIRMISKMPKWKPGWQEGENISLSYLLPVRF